jgi:hypothetical protein
MLTVAQEILQNMPGNPIFETSYESRNNPGKLYGEVLGRKAVAILDVHWPDIAVARDWKTGKFHGEKYTEQYEIQSYFCGTLFEQKYDKPLEAMHFDFLLPNKTYTAKVIKDSRERSKVEYRINQVLKGIEKESFQKKKSKLCDYCQYNFCCDSLDGV